MIGYLTELRDVKLKKRRNRIIWEVNLSFNDTVLSTPSQITEFMAQHVDELQIRNDLALFLERYTDLEKIELNLPYSTAIAHKLSKLIWANIGVLHIDREGNVMAIRESYEHPIYPYYINLVSRFMESPNEILAPNILKGGIDAIMLMDKDDFLVAPIIRNRNNLYVYMIDRIREMGLEDSYNGLKPIRVEEISDWGLDIEISYEGVLMNRLKSGVTLDPHTGLVTLIKVLKWDLDFKDYFITDILPKKIGKRKIPSNREIVIIGKEDVDKILKNPYKDEIGYTLSYKQSRKGIRRYKSAYHVDFLTPAFYGALHYFHEIK